MEGKERVTWGPSVGAGGGTFDIDSIPGSLSLLYTRSTRSSVDLKARTGPTATSRETAETLPLGSLTPQRRSLTQSRRSVPSLRSPSLQTQTPSAANRAPKVSPNALKRPHPHSRGPDAKRAMPSSVAYSETRTLPSGHSRSLNGPRLESRAATIDDGRPKNDDIFLNIARSDSRRRDSVGRSDFRRSRLGGSGQTLQSPTARYDTENTPSPDQRFSNVDPLLAQNTLPNDTIQLNPSHTSRMLPPRAPTVNGDHQERRSSLYESRLNRHSGLSTIRGSRQPSASEATERGRDEHEKPRADGTESTLSTNAPSTLWDELDDLKSRIHKLELTGKLPPSSQEAMSMSVNERPRTAATTMTAISTSPRHHRKASIPSAETEGVSNQVHPLLQSALAKAKTVLSSDVYAALEVTITDAIAMSTMLGVNTAPSGTVSVVNGGLSSSERQARRKADSVCRSLTELCLALTDEELKRKRPSSSRGLATTQPLNSNGDNDTLRPGSSYQRSGSHEPEVSDGRLSQSTNRISSRLGARRASVANPPTGVPAESKLAQSPSLPTPPSRLHRISTSLRSRRPPPADDDKTETPSVHSRSLSRATTDLGTPSPGQGVSPRQRLPHGHSASHSISGAQQEPGLGISPRPLQYQSSPQYQSPDPSQMPASQPRTPTASSQSGVPFRRSYASPGAFSLATPRSSIQSGSRRYGLSPNTPSNATLGPGAEASPRSPQAEQPQTRISIPSAKSVTSYTPIHQPRLRTNSLGTRRFGLRRHSTLNQDDASNFDDSID
ncbi:hypothetical protein N7468_004059 [Penicillium chermesinum]|uniref:LPXTG-motif cell wall anchor domain protein n=1 Tax=Penicillium chermesinum TaxID=63820 RepID=A0A9W9TS73_9EURO|nr:uncharacterized protein N7468_004059 [Penicillium chermesinum]KAJ5239440.1 hypothetical protein N7468_004059 [Penicillium chermesinum]